MLNEQPVITKKEAIARGLTRYYTGKPCVNGHVAERFVTNGCTACALEKTQRWRNVNREKARSDERARYAVNRETIRARKNKANRAYRAADPEAFREKERLRREADPEAYRQKSKAWREANAEELRAKQKAWREANAEKIKADKRIWDEANKERRRAYAQERRAANPDEHRSQKHRRRARQHKAEGFHTKEDIARIRKLQKDRCAECKISLKGKGARDHIVSLCRGGTNWPSNIQLLCLPCNNRKHAKLPIDWARENGRLL